MKRSRVLLAAVLAVAVLATSAILGACSGGGGGGTAAQQPTPKVQLSGTISGSYGYAKPSLSKSLSGPAVPLIDKVVAIPMSRGSLDAFQMTSRVTAAIGADGKFDLALPKDKDWLLVLIQSPNTFVSSLAINAGSDSILNLPATVSTLNSFNLGTISGTPGVDALSSPTVTASNFGMSASQFTAFANSDDVFKNAKNIINNYNTTTGVWYQLRPDFTWDGDYAAINGAYSGPNWAYQSFNFQMDTNATNLNIHNLCSVGSGTWSPVVVGWTPPSDVSTVGNFVTFGTTTPITNSGATCTTYSSDNGPATEASGTPTNPFYATDAYWGPYGTISYSMPIWFDGAIPSGNWTWWEGDPSNVIATFDPSVSTPVNGSGGSLGYVPSIQLTVSGGVITAVDVQWWYYDEVLDTYTQVTSAEDYAVMSHFIERAEVIIESGVGAATRRHSSFGFDPTVASERHLVLPASGADSWTYADMISGTPFLDSDAGSIGVFYSSGGIGRYFFARATMTN